MVSSAILFGGNGYFPKKGHSELHWVAFDLSGHVCTCRLDFGFGMLGKSRLAVLC